MEQNRIVQTVVETPTYLAIAHKLFGDEERADIAGEAGDRRGPGCGTGVALVDSCYQ